MAEAFALSERPALTVVSERLKRGPRKRRFIKSFEAEVAGWAFHVPMPAFAAALDMGLQTYVYEQALSDGSKRDVARDELTKGDAFAFEVGDTMHSPKVPPGPWAVQKELIDCTAQVVTRDGDELVVSLHRWRKGTVEKRRLNQVDFVELLRTGAED